jgi:large conductance mechanosensitive channel
VGPLCLLWTWEFREWQEETPPGHRTLGHGVMPFPRSNYWKKEVVVLGMIAEFKEFAVKGNVMDMAAGIIIGGAFGKVVSSLVNDVLMPPIGVLLGGVDFADLAITLKRATLTTPAVVLGYGKFVQTVVDFLIVAWAVFLIVKVMNVLRRQKSTDDKAA